MTLPQEKKIPFLGMDDVDIPSWNDSHVIILPIPFEKTVSCGHGTALGPEAILRASAHVETFDEELEIEPCDSGIYTAKALEFGDLDAEESIKMIEEAAFKIIENGKFPLGLGGEHSISSALVKAAHRRYPDLHVVHLDAHADMRHEYHGTIWSHASVMHRIYEIGLPYTSIGIRSMSPEEYKVTRKNRDNYFFAHEIAADAGWIKKAIAKIKGSVLLTLDVDVFDCGLLPHTGTPEPGGLTWYQVTGFLKELMSSRSVVGADVVELAPTSDSMASDFMIAKLVHKIIGYWWNSPCKARFGSHLS